MSDGLEQAIERQTTVSVWTRGDEVSTSYNEVKVLTVTPTYIEVLVPATGDDTLDGFRAIVPWCYITEIVLHD